jgi:hypothetical protein
MTTTENNKVKVELSDDMWIFEDENGKPVSNSVPENIREFEAYADEESEPVLYVEWELRYHDGTRSKRITVLKSELDSTDLSKKDSKHRIHPRFGKTKAQRYIAQHILSVLDSSESEPEKVYEIETNGFHERENVRFFRAGQTIICPAGKKNALNLKLKSLPQKFTFDVRRYSESEATAGTVKLIGLCPSVGQVIFSHMISGVTRPLFIEAGITPCSVPQVIGEFNSFKTTYVSLLTQMYDRDGQIKPVTRLNSTINFIEDVLHANVSNCIIIDDLHPADSGGAVRKNSATLEELIRIAGDSRGKGRMDGKSAVGRDPRCSVIAIGEMPFGEGSTASRSLIVPLQERIDPVKLHECQSEPLLLSTWMYYFLQWVVDNYSQICDLIKDLLTDFRGFVFNVKPRLKETYFCLNTSFLIFLQYSVERGLTTSYDADELLTNYQRHLKLLIVQQNARAIRNTDSIHGDVSYPRLIKSLYERKHFHVAGSRESFNEREHDGLIKDDCLCLLSDNLMKKVKKEVPTAILDSIIDSLSSIGALATGNGKDKKRTKQIRIRGKNVRFYFIPLDRLK